MHANIRRGLLSTLFAGGLLALGTTAASAADTTSGSDGLTSGTTATVSAVVAANSSLGLLGDSTPENSTNELAAVVDVNLGTGTAGTTGTDTTTAGDLTAAVDVNLGTGNAGTNTTTTTNTANEHGVDLI
jgi:hypothetical protein